MKINVFLNRQETPEGRLAIFSRLHHFDVYRDDDKLELVYSYELDEPSTDHALNRVFSDFNRGSSTFVGDSKYPHRSLSAGDVVEVNGDRFYVNHIGFEPLPA